MKLPSKLFVVSDDHEPKESGVYLTGRQVLNNLKVKEWFAENLDLLLRNGTSQIPLDLPVAPYLPHAELQPNLLNKIFTDGVRKLITPGLQCVVGPAITMRNEPLNDLRACVLALNILEHFVRADIPLFSYEEIKAREGSDEEMSEERDVVVANETAKQLVDSLKVMLAPYGLTTLDFRFLEVYTINFRHEHDGRMFVFDFKSMDEMKQFTTTLAEELGFVKAGDLHGRS